MGQQSLDWHQKRPAASCATGPPLSVRGARRRWIHEKCQTLILRYDFNCKLDRPGAFGKCDEIAIFGGISSCFDSALRRRKVFWCRPAGRRRSMLLRNLGVLSRPYVRVTWRHRCPSSGGRWTIVGRMLRATRRTSAAGRGRMTTRLLQRQMNRPRRPVPHAPWPDRRRWPSFRESRRPWRRRGTSRGS